MAADDTCQITSLERKPFDDNDAVDGLSGLPPYQGPSAAGFRPHTPSPKLRRFSSGVGDELADRSHRSAETSLQSAGLTGPALPGSPLIFASLPLLKTEMERAKSAFGSAELAVLWLMGYYDFSMTDLERVLCACQYVVSFSRVTYSQMAPRYGFNPRKATNDIPRFPLRRARLPSDIFFRILEDMTIMLNLYGPLVSHAAEIGRCAYMAPIFNRIIAHLKPLINNIPEALFEGRMTTKGRIEFRAFGAVTMLFIEANVKLGTPQERLKYIAQLLAEGDACDYDNFKQGYNIPIYGILTDGDVSRFFWFTRQTGQRLTASRLSVEMGMNSDGLTEIGPLPFGRCLPTAYAKSLRPICEIIYSVILHGFIDGLSAYWQLSENKGKGTGTPPQSTPACLRSLGVAKQALSLAEEAADIARNSADYATAQAAAVSAWKLVQEAVQLAPQRNRNVYDLMQGLTPAEFDDA